MGTLNIKNATYKKSYCETIKLTTGTASQNIVSNLQSNGDKLYVINSIYVCNTNASSISVSIWVNGGGMNNAGITDDIPLAYHQVLVASDKNTPIYLDNSGGDVHLAAFNSSAGTTNICMVISYDIYE
jgi:hypothetical protein